MRMICGHPQRGVNCSIRMFAVTLAVNTEAVTANMSARRLKRSVKSKIQVLSRGVTSSGPK